MTKFEFEATGSIHDEGTKYYQVIRIANAAAHRAIVVTHWGKVHPGAPQEPKHHGQNKIEEVFGSGVPQYNERYANKRKRGYTAWKNTHDRVAIDEVRLVAGVNEWFNRADADKILAWLSPIEKDDAPTLDEGEPIDWDDKHEEVYPPAPASADKEEWGTW